MKDCYWRTYQNPAFTRCRECREPTEECPYYIEKRESDAVDQSLGYIE